MDKDTKTCPHCGQKIKYVYHGRSYNHKAWAMIVTTCKGWQVFRTFEVNAHYTRDKGFTYDINEVVQNWFRGLDRVILARPFVPMSSIFSVSREMSYRQIRKYSTYYINQYVYDEATDIYPYKRVTETFRRNGFKGNFHNANPIQTYEALLGNNKLETLWKAGQYALFKHLLYERRPLIPEHCIKIALRHQYKVRDAGTWADYLDQLEELGKDTHNPKLILRSDLVSEHRRLMKLVEIKREREEAYKKRCDAMKTNAEKLKEYLKCKKPYLGIKFDDGHLFFHVLQTPQEFIEEGKAMHHCVANYWKYPNSLIMSARDDKGDRIETIEVSLDTFTISQSRGHCNKDSQFHQSIIDLVNANMQKIRCASHRDKALSVK